MQVLTERQIRQLIEINIQSGVHAEIADKVSTLNSFIYNYYEELDKLRDRLSAIEAQLRLPLQVRISQANQALKLLTQFMNELQGDIDRTSEKV